MKAVYSWNIPRSFKFEDGTEIYLEKGINVLNERDYQKLSGSPRFQALLREQWVSVVEPDFEKLLAEGHLQLKDVSGNDIHEVLAQVTNKELLQRLLREEPRPMIKEALRVRIAQLG